MKIIYEIFIITINALSIPFRLFSKKIDLFHEGRKDTFRILKKDINPNEKNIWFHVSSLGEFEIAKPIIEELKVKVNNLKIIVTFFSPSGYENVKNYKHTDSITYLPVDLSNNAKKFIKYVNPKVAVIIKNDLWPNYISELKKNNSIIYSVSSKFKQGNFYFGIFGKWFLDRLKMIDFFYVQDNNSKLILNKYSIQNVVESGDSRFTSVIKTLNENKRIDVIEKFVNNNKCFIAGSVWRRDIKIIKESITNNNIKSIIAPHEVSKRQINELENIFGNSCVKLSCLVKEEDFQKKVLIVDSIGKLRYMYKYANFCYVGGGFSNNSLHNILEPSVFSCPVIIGNLYHGFKEAEDLIDLGGVISINNSVEFSKIFNELCHRKEKEKKLGKINSDYVYKNEKNNSKVIDSLIKTLR
ncbi:MAG: 3-deoxy-D-manno-octulosonic acid transferase [Flavobacteriaceae bacterium]|nr:3-deoxy-D-manno-octulosonic acid transferase [Cryomorphaceae bacterium]MBL6677297.1 3-deoxy-D-manno-octulosonic acid transferase [Flavobacteriaceae bacterium]MDA0330576.1 3-deoxy-D-manno-octulosonic acid transferase [Bacteroidota bacterium]MDA1225485.1 3-deoxy-D-manno-octulosonic acid transferase [Bacteroidota bacterium]